MVDKTVVERSPCFLAEVQPLYVLSSLFDCLFSLCMFFAHIRHASHHIDANQWSEEDVRSDVLTFIRDAGVISDATISDTDGGGGDGAFRYVAIVSHVKILHCTYRILYLISYILNLTSYILYHLLSHS